MRKFTNVSLLTVCASIVLLSGCTTTDNAQNTPLAECLTSKGATMYGTNRCSHCQNQKELFGYEAFAKINFVDCDKQKNVCALEGVQGYPTWKFANGTTLAGEQNLDALAQAAGCSSDGVAKSEGTTATGEVMTGVVSTGDVVITTGTQEVVSSAVSTGN